MTKRDNRVFGGVYRAGQIISAGGILTTYTAYNHNTNDVVGLYIVEPASPGQIQIVQQLQPNLDKRRLIRSPHVIRICDWGIDDNRIFIATDPPRGVTLQHLFDHENIDISRAIDLTRQLAAGLQALHEQGIVGLDLRPQLITIDTIGVTDRVQIDDIGLRSLLLSLGYISSQRNDDIGYFDPRYSPPEYLHGGQVGPWSDIYQVGLHFFALITGRLPFVGITPAETAIMQITSPVPLLSQYAHTIPAMLQSLVECALEKDPGKRFVNADTFICALNNVASSLQSGQHKDASGTLVPQRQSGQHKNASGTLVPQIQSGQYKDASDTIVPQLSSTNLTLEMPQLQSDIAKSETLIEPSSDILLAAMEKTITNVPNEEGVYAYLCSQGSGSQLQRFPITQKSVIIGRVDPKRGVRPDVDLTTLDPTMTISRSHARIRFEETFFYIEDLKSRNKTRIGPLILTPLKADLLQHGDIVQFGSVRLRFEVPSMDKPPFKGKPAG